MINFPKYFNSIHRRCAKHPALVRLALLVRNQMNCIIQYHLNEGADPQQNGEDWLAKVTSPTASLFIDVGANIGNWAALYLTAASPNIHGVLFEPSGDAFMQLKQRFCDRSGIELVQAAISDVEGQMPFFEEPFAGETSSLIAGFSNSQAIKKMITVTTLGSEINKRKLGHVDFLKIDTEGYDLNVLRGASDLLSQHQIALIQFEYNKPWALTGSTFAEAYNLLTAFDYKIFLLKSKGLFQLNYDKYGEYFTYSNFVAVSPHKFDNIQPFIKGII